VQVFLQEKSAQVHEGCNPHMARLYSRSKGKAGSKKPLDAKKQPWVSYSNEEIEKLIVKLAKSGLTASQIGLNLRDRYGIPDVQVITSKKISQILKEHGALPKLPEDLISLIRREIDLAKHLETNKKDTSAQRGLILTESKIKRLVKYYKAHKMLPLTWEFSRENAKLLIG